MASKGQPGRLQIDVHFDCALAPPVTALGAAGLVVASSVKSGTLCVVEGWAASGALAQIQEFLGRSAVAQSIRARDEA